MSKSLNATGPTITASDVENVNDRTLGDIQINISENKEHEIKNHKMDGDDVTIEGTLRNKAHNAGSKDIRKGHVLREIDKQVNSNSKVEFDPLNKDRII